jgi:hypothetical protein
LNVTTFLASVNDQTHKMTLGQLLRILLPFTEETSSADQTILPPPSSTTGNNTNAAYALVESTLEEQYPHLLQHAMTLYSYQQEFLVLRKLIRVKIADEADYKQVSTPEYRLAFNSFFFFFN